MRYIKVAAFIMLILLVLPLSVGATEDSEAWGREYKEMIEALPEDISGLLPEKLFSDKVGDIAEGAKEAVSFLTAFQTYSDFENERKSLFFCLSLRDGIGCAKANSPRYGAFCEDREHRSVVRFGTRGHIADACLRKVAIFGR